MWIGRVDSRANNKDRASPDQSFPASRFSSSHLASRVAVSKSAAPPRSSNPTTYSVTLPDRTTASVGSIQILSRSAGMMGERVTRCVLSPQSC